MPLIDLHRMSRELYAALGADLPKAFQDGTHHNALGSYLLARCVVEGLRQNELDICRFLRPEVGPFNPAKPGVLARFAVPPSPHYMSPEQAKGVDLDGRSDQYSLALVGYQMLTGQTPFQADSPHSVLLKHILKVLPPVRSARPDVPSHVSEALARALAKEPAERFATMEEFAGALADESRAARSGPRRSPAPARSRGRPQARSNRRRLIGLALVAVAAVAVPAWLLLVRGATPSDAGAGEVPQSAARAVQDSEPAAPARDSQAAAPARDTEPASRPSEPARRSAVPPRAGARQAPAAVPARPRPRRSAAA